MKGGRARFIVSVLHMRMKVIAMLSLFVFLLPTTFVQAKSSAIVGVSTVYAEKAGNVELVVFIDSDERIAGGSFELDFDPALLTVRENTVIEGAALTDQLFSLHGGEAGKIGLSWAQATSVSMKGTLVTFTGNVPRASVGQEIPLKLKNVHLFTGNGTEVSAQLLHGQVTPFDGITTEEKETVDGNKPWTITLSKGYNPATVNEHTVRVLDRTGKPVDIIVKQGAGNTIVVTPETEYKRGSYTLEISDQIRSMSGSKLNAPRRHEFTVK